MTSETPIYDATCRDVGAPADEASGPPVLPDDPSDDAVTSELFLPGVADPPPRTGDR
ncbi:hypothetical protein GCM10023200_23920 [Actinomycetospora chlora]|uniref:Uncharacterized protein n=1 Tax=Actinomycetospora chlora TaxID=663608 RepID=A0ABP9B1D7_9PSEU